MLKFHIIHSFSYFPWLYCTQFCDGPSLCLYSAAIPLILKWMGMNNCVRTIDASQETVQNAWVALIAISRWNFLSSGNVLYCSLKFPLYSTIPYPIVFNMLIFLSITCESYNRHFISTIWHWDNLFTEIANWGWTGIFLCIKMT